MTKLTVMSDLHIDLNGFGDFETETLIQTLKSQDTAHLHLAGDISNHHQEISLPFLEKMAEHFKVTYNFGNHDMLDLKESEIKAQDFQIIPFENKTLLAFHGWYDYSFYPEKSDLDNLNFKNRFWFDRRLNRGLSDKELTLQTAQQLDKTLARIDNDVIVSMHFVPHSHFTMTHETFRPFNAFLGSQIFHDIFQKHGVNDVVFGHAHRSFGQVDLNGIRYHSRPLGYVREWNLTIDYVQKHPELNPTGTWNLSKRYNLVKKLSHFQNYKKENLEREFLNSMSIFDL